MLQVSLDFRDEVDEFHRFLQTLEPADWERKTGFMDWTPWDVVAHLHYFDLVSRASLGGEEAFKPERKDLLAAVAEGRTNQELGRERFAGLDSQALLGAWRDTAHALSEALAAAPPKQRLPGFGPAIRPASARRPGARRGRR